MVTLVLVPKLWYNFPMTRKNKKNSPIEVSDIVKAYIESIGADGLCLENDGNCACTKNNLGGNCEGLMRIECSPARKLTAKEVRAYRANEDIDIYESKEGECFVPIQ